MTTVPSGACRRRPPYGGTGTAGSGFGHRHSLTLTDVTIMGPLSPTPSSVRGLVQRWLRGRPVRREVARSLVVSRRWRLPRSAEEESRLRAVSLAAPTPLRRSQITGRRHSHKSPTVSPALAPMKRHTLRSLVLPYSVCVERRVGSPSIFPVAMGLVQLLHLGRRRAGERSF